MILIPQYEISDVLVASDNINKDSYNVYKDGKVIFESDDLYEAQKVCLKEKGVISGKGIMYMFKINKV